MDGPQCVVLFDLIGARTTVALGLLGICGHLCAECPDKKPDWAGVSAGCDFSVPADHEKPASHSETAPGFEHRRVPCNSRTLAHSRSSCESSRGRSQRIFVVLLCQ